MSTYRVSDAADDVLLRNAPKHASDERNAMAVLLEEIGEIDERRLYLEVACPSLLAYCMRDLRLSEDVALRRIQAARVVRRFPVILPALADGALCLSSVLLMAAHLEPDNAAELVAAASFKSKSEIHRLLAQRRPQPAPLLEQVAPERVEAEVAPERVEAEVAPERVDAEVAPERVERQVAPERVEAEVAPERVATATPVQSPKFPLRFEVGQEEYDNFRYAQRLLSHAVPSGNMREIFGRAMKALVRELEKAKFAAGAKERPIEPGSTVGKRHIPAHVRDAVWQRDGGQCTFTSADGRRCEARESLEFDHVREFARGGEATVEGIRLLCRPHNQYRAERTYGVDFMRQKRAEARGAAARARAVENETRATDQTRKMAAAVEEGRAAPSSAAM